MGEGEGGDSDVLQLDPGRDVAPALKKSLTAWGRGRGVTPMFYNWMGEGEGGDSDVLQLDPGRDVAPALKKSLTAWGRGRGVTPMFYNWIQAVMSRQP